MFDDDLADCLDALAVAPLFLNEQRQLLEMAEFERRRLAWLDAYPLADCDSDADAATQPRKGARAHFSIAGNAVRRGKAP